MTIAKRILILITSLALLIAFSACSYFLPGEEKVLAPELIDSKEVIMPTTKVKRGDLIMFHDIEATFSPEPTERHLAEITINGTVSKIYYFMGEEVKKGDLVLELDTEVINDKILIQEINVEKMRLAHEQNLAMFELGKADRYTVELSGLSLESAQNYLSDLKEELSQHYVYAPTDGVIVSMRFSVGDYAFGDAFEVSDIDKGIIEIKIRSDKDYLSPAEEALYDLEIGDSAILLYEGYEYELELLRDASTYFTDIEYDPEYTHTQFKVLELPEGIGFNKGVTVRNITDIALDTVVIPVNAVYSAEMNPYTYVVNGRDFDKRYIEIGMSDGYFYEVVSGLTEGEEILKVN